VPPLSAKNQAARAGRVGASEVAALLDCGHPFRTPADLYANIVHGIDTFSGNARAVEMGHVLEPVVLRIGMEQTGLRVRRNSLSRKHPMLPLVVTYDAVVVGTSPPEVVEVKTASAYMAEEWRDGEDNPTAPPHYYAQVQAQLMVSGASRGRLWALIGGREFIGLEVPADPELQREIAERITAFYRDHITPRIPPADTPPDLLWSFDVPEGVAAASSEMEAIGTVIVGLMGQQDAIKIALGDARSGLIERMGRDGLRLVRHPSWTAESKPNKSGKRTLRFTRLSK